MSPKKSILTAIGIGACATLFYAPAIMAADGPFVAGMFGTALVSDSTLTEPGGSVDLEFDTGWNLAFMAGYKVGMLRVEGEIGYQQNDADKFSGGILGPLSVDAGGDVDLWRFMVNGYWDFDNSTTWTPYVVAGLGMANVEVNDLSVAGLYIGSEDDSVFAYQFGAGLDYAFNDYTSIFVDYRYFATEDPDFSGTEAEVASNNFSIGLRYIF